MYLNLLFGFPIYKLFFYFIIYSFLGWCTEVIYAAFKRGKFVNRGFLNGPFCPVYGFGALILIVVLNPIKNNMPLLFIFSILLTSLLEYITGYVLEKAFNTTWWDYSDNKFNIKGRICLSFSIIWGLVSMVVVKMAHPVIEQLVDSINLNYIPYLYYGFIIYFFIDFLITLTSLIQLKSIITELNEVSKEIKAIYDELKDKASEKAEDIEIHIKELKNKYEELFKDLKFEHIRIIKAFPDMSSKKFDNILKEIQNKIKFRL